MNEIPEDKLAEQLDPELRRLTGYRAPRTLAPRVMAAIAARNRAVWWTKPWPEWPAGMRLLFLAVSVVLTGGVVLAGLQLPQFTHELSTTIFGWFGGLAPYFSFASHFLGAVWSSLKAAPPGALWGLATMLGLAYAVCVCLGTLGYRVALNRI
jgi:hypothetical protein